MDVVAVYEAARQAADTRAPRRRAVLRRVPDLPLSRPLDVRSGSLPRQGRGRGVEEARADPQPDQPAQGRRHADRGSISRHRRRGDERGRGGGRLRRGRYVGAASRTSPATCTRRARHEDHLSRSDAAGAARRAVDRPARLPDGRGRRQVRRQLRGVQGVPRRVRTGAHPRHAAVGARVRRRGHRRRAGRHAPDRRGDDGQFQPAGARPDREHGGRCTGTCRAASSAFRW